MAIIDDKYLQGLKLAFKFSDNKSFCQVATVAKTEQGCLPKSRTVLLHLIEPRNVFRFTCSRQSQKWAELKVTPKVTGLYFDAENFTQYRFEADALLIDETMKNEEEIYRSSWASVRPDLRHILWQEYLNKKEGYDINEVCPNHGVVLLSPYYWDIFTLGVEDFAHSRRVQMALKQGEWKIYESGAQTCPLKIER